MLNDASLAVTIGDAAVHEIADHAGCRVVEALDAAGVLPAALTAARGPRLLLLRAGCVPGQGFVEELADFLRSGAGESAILRQMPAPGLARLFPSLAPVAGLIGSQTRMRAAGRRSLTDLARHLRPARTLRCGTMVMN